MKRYLTIYFQLLKFSIQSELSYRFSLFFKLLHGPAYVAVLFTVLQLAFSRTETLGGWNKTEATLLFAVFNMMYATCLIMFTDSMRYLLWNGIRLGEVDTWLTKPGSPQFYLNFSRPNMDMIALWLGMIIVFCYSIFTVPDVQSSSFLLFTILFILGHSIIYFTLSTYTTLGFYVTRAQQILEVFDKSTDLAQYPLSIFPRSIQAIFVTILPIAFFSYIPVLFLLGRGTWQLFLLTIVATGIFGIINQFAWKTALKHYSSASS